MLHSGFALQYCLVNPLSPIFGTPYHQTHPSPTYNLASRVPCCVEPWPYSSRERVLHRKGAIFIALIHYHSPNSNAVLFTNYVLLWPPDAKNRLIWRDPDPGKDWGWEEKGSTEDEMVGWHHRLNGHEFEQTPEDDEGLEAWRAAVLGVVKSRTWLSDWTELNWTECITNVLCTSCPRYMQRSKENWSKNPYTHV